MSREGRRAVLVSAEAPSEPAAPGLLTAPGLSGPPCLTSAPLCVDGARSGKRKAALSRERADERFARERSSAGAAAHDRVAAISITGAPIRYVLVRGDCRARPAPTLPPSTKHASAPSSTRACWRRDASLRRPSGPAMKAGASGVGPAVCGHPDLSDRPSALRRSALLRTGRAPFNASGSSRP